MHRRRLYLSQDKMIGGVAAGIAEYFDIDPTIVRLAWLFVAATGVGILAYFAAWIIVPEKPTAYREQADTPDSKERSEPTQETAAELRRAAQELVEAGGEVGEELRERIRAAVDQISRQETETRPRHSVGEPEEEPSSNRESSRTIGILLIAFGALFLLGNILPRFAWSTLWPVVIIVIGIALLVKGVGNR